MSKKMDKYPIVRRRPLNEFLSKNEGFFVIHGVARPKKSFMHAWMWQFRHIDTLAQTAIWRKAQKSHHAWEIKGEAYQRPPLQFILKREKKKLCYNFFFMIDFQ